MEEYITRRDAIQAVVGAALPDKTEDGIPIANGKRSVTDCVRRIKEIPAANDDLLAELENLRTYAANISMLPSCNTCLKNGLCEFMPQYGDYCRINCPAWLGETLGVKS